MLRFVRIELKKFSFDICTRLIMKLTIKSLRNIRILKGDGKFTFGYNSFVYPSAYFIGLPPARWLVTSMRKERWRIAQKSRSMKYAWNARQGYRSSCKDLGLRYSGKMAVTGGWANGSWRSISIPRDYPSSHLPRYVPSHWVESIDSTFLPRWYVNFLSRHTHRAWLRFSFDIRGAHVTWSIGQYCRIAN